MKTALCHFLSLPCFTDLSPGFTKLAQGLFNQEKGMVMSDHKEREFHSPSRGLLQRQLACSLRQDNNSVESRDSTRVKKTYMSVPHAFGQIQRYRKSERGTLHSSAGQRMDTRRCPLGASQQNYPYKKHHHITTLFARSPNQLCEGVCAGDAEIAGLRMLP